MVFQAPPGSSKEAKYFLISILTASDLTNSISLRLVQCMRRPRSQHEAHINRPREMTDKGSPQRPDCVCGWKVGDWVKREEGLVFSAVL